MNEYRHHVSGFFSNRDDAENAFSTLVKRGLPRDRLQIFETLDGTLGTRVSTCIRGLIGATTGAITGSTTPTRSKVWWFTTLLRDATSSTQIVLVVDNRTEQDTAIAREVMQASVGDY